MNEKALVLMSGYLAFDNASFIKNNSDLPNNVITQWINLNRRFNKTEAEYFFNSQVDDAYLQYERNPKLANDLDFRLEVCKLAANCFSNVNNNFYTWLTLQFDSPFLTSLHRQFLDETLSALMPVFSLINEDYKTGLGLNNSINRKISLTSWESMLSLRARNALDEKFVTTNFDVSRNKINVQNNNSTNLEEFISYWISFENGFEDLIYFLFIVFGHGRQVRLA